MGYSPWGHKDLDKTKYTHDIILAAILKDLHCASLTVFLVYHFKKKNRKREYLGNTDEVTLAHNEKHNVKINFNYL